MPPHPNSGKPVLRWVGDGVFGKRSRRVITRSVMAALRSRSLLDFDTIAAMRFFDPDDKVLIKRRRLPHWSQAGTVVFVTWRTHDSIPKEVLEKWLNERNDWLASHHLDPAHWRWKSQLQRLPGEQLLDYHNRFTTRWHDELDACHGACVLRQAALAIIVADSLRHFDGDRYEMLQLVIMPNHVHFLACFPDRTSMLRQCESWKTFTAREINRRVGRLGRFWQQDAFDHLVRHEAQFQRLQQYIADNPPKARLEPGEFLLWKRGVR